MGASEILVLQSRPRFRYCSSNQGKPSPSYRSVLPLLESPPTHYTQMFSEGGTLGSVLKTPVIFCTQIR